jgi:hypothetical protein
MILLVVLSWIRDRPPADRVLLQAAVAQLLGSRTLGIGEELAAFCACQPTRAHEATQTVVRGSAIAEVALAGRVIADA